MAFPPMPEILSPSPLQLPDLGICASRRIGDLTIPWLGRVTPFAGRNGVGRRPLLQR